VQPFIIACGLATQEELDSLYERALQEMTQEDFCVIGFGQVVWGKKEDSFMLTLKEGLALV
jgi:hypothetical protein